MRLNDKTATNTFKENGLNLILGKYSLMHTYMNIQENGVVIKNSISSKGNVPNLKDSCIYDKLKPQTPQDVNKWSKTKYGIATIVAADITTLHSRQ